VSERGVHDGPGGSKAGGDQNLFQVEAWTRALARYCAATHLTVEVIRSDGDRPFAPVGLAPLFNLLAGSGHDPDLFVACARRCLVQPAGAPPVIERRHSLAVVGTPLTLAGTTVGAAVAGYVVTAFPDQQEVQRLAIERGIPFADLRAALRRQLPLTGERLLVYGELLQTLCDSITDGKQAEAALRTAHDELERRVGERTMELAAAVDTLQSEVAERTQAEEALHDSRAQLAGIIDSAMDGIITIDEDQRILLFNSAAEEVFLCSSAEAIGQPIDRFVPERFHQVHREHIRAFGTSEITRRRLTPALRNVTGIRTNGEEFPIEAAISRSEAGGQKVFTIVLRDITERKRAEQALQASEERVRLLLDSTAEAIYGLDLQGRCIFCNRTCLRLLGYDDPSDLLGRNMHALLHHTHPDGTPYPQEACRIFEAFRRGEGTHADDEVLWRANGTSFPAEYWSYPVRRGEEVVGSVVTFLDITERRRAEAEIQSSREQLRELAFHVEAVREGERIRIAREIHDDLGQALTALKVDLARLAAKLPREQPALVESVRVMIGVADAAIHSMRRIATDLRPPVLDDLGLMAALDWQAREFQERTGIACRFTSGVADLPIGPEAATAIFRICQEALTNVTRHACATAVEIRLAADGGTVVMIAQDNGRGITDGERADKKSLGLLGMRERAALLGGEAIIAGRPGEGTTVTLRLPLDPPPGR
jgi:PAS domain S-box-containing protein